MHHYHRNREIFTAHFKDGFAAFKKTAPTSNVILCPHLKALKTNVQI